MHIDHIAIWSKNPEKMKHFYQKYFGCSVNDKYINQKKKDFHHIFFPLIMEPELS